MDRRVGPKIIASAVLFVGLALLWGLVLLMSYIGCAWDASCGTREAGIAGVVGLALLAVFGYAMVRIWRR